MMGISGRLTDAAAQLKTVHAGHHDVEDGKIVRRTLQLIERVGGGVTCPRAQAFGDERVHHQVGDRALVIDHQYVRRFFHTRIISPDLRRDSRPTKAARTIHPHIRIP